jgi:hypothetical protein
MSHPCACRTAIALVSLALATTSPSRAQAPSPLADLNGPAQKGTYCSSCFPRPYGLRLTLTWQGSADIDLWVVVPTHLRPKVKGGAVYWKSDGVPDLAWLDLDDGPHKPGRSGANSFREDFFADDTALGQATLPMQWCAQIDVYKVHRPPPTTSFTARLVLSPRVGAEIECVATAAFTARNDSDL